MPTFDQMLDNLATLALEVGVNLQDGQNLLLLGPIDAPELMRRIATGAFERGAPQVLTVHADEHMALIRARHARAEHLDRFPQEYADMVRTAAARGDAYLRVSGGDPDLLSAADPERVATMLRAQRRALRPVSDLVQRAFMPWTIVNHAGLPWARKVFPELDDADAVARLWDAVFAATRADEADPVAAWREHLAELAHGAERLNQASYTALHLRGPGTDLRLGLADSHVWEGGAIRSESLGLPFVPNMPTEEVFTAPHAARADGTVRSSMPLSYQGQIVDGFSLTFEGGAVVEFSAQRGERVLAKLLDTDEGARRLGEVALVPHSSPISRSGLLFYNTLYDENAACHLALGRAYEGTFRDGTERSLEELVRDGFNDSLTHVDFMVGSDELDVDGIRADGSSVPVMRSGEWAIEQPVRG